MHGNPAAAAKARQSFMVEVSIIEVLRIEILNDSVGFDGVHAYFSCLHQVSRRKKPATKAARLVTSRLTKAQV